MTRQVSFPRKLALALLVACSLFVLSAWAVVAATICSNPRSPEPETQQIIPYNCHGMTVFISGIQDSLLHWLFPIFALLSLVTVIVALFTVARLHIDVRVTVTGEHADK